MSCCFRDVCVVYLFVYVLCLCCCYYCYVSFVRSAQVRAYDDSAQCRNIGIPYRRSLCPFVLCPYLCSSDFAARARIAESLCAEDHAQVLRGQSQHRLVADKWGQH